MCIEWLNWVATTSIPLVALDEDGNPQRIASGTLANYRNRRFLLSVQHAVQRGMNNWVVRVRGRENGMEVFHLGEFIYLGEMVRGIPEIREIDFCFIEVSVDLAPLFQNINMRGEILEQADCQIFNTDLDNEPELENMYAFAGRVRSERHPNNVLLSEFQVYPGLRYVESLNEVHSFRLPVPHPGHDRFEGCSGAPLVDQNQNVVAVVTGGNVEENLIYGTSVTRYRFALDLLIDGL